MKMVEITYTAELKELEKLQTRLEKKQAKLEKVQAKADKMGVTDDVEAHRAWLATVETQDGFIVKKEDREKNGLFYDLVMTKDDIESLESKIEMAESRLEKKQKALEEYREEVEQIENLKEREKLMKESFEAEQREWAKDGIILEARYRGTTPKGNKFTIYGNSGYTERSQHCFTLYINGETIFTSGEFWRAYGVIKNS